MDQYELSLSLTPLTNERPTSDQADWLQNDDQSLLGKLSEKLEANPTLESTSHPVAREKHATNTNAITIGETYYFTALTIKQTTYGFIAFDDEHEYFLNDGDCLVIAEQTYQVAIHKHVKKARSNETNEITQNEQTPDLLDDIWGHKPLVQSNLALPTTPLNSTEVNPTPQVNKSHLDFLYDEPIEQSMPNLYGQTIGGQPSQMETGVDLHSLVPLNPIATPLTTYDNDIAHSPQHATNNILQDLGIDKHAVNLIQDENTASGQSFLEQTPLDMADEYLREDMQAELQQRYPSSGTTAMLQTNAMHNTHAYIHSAAHAPTNSLLEKLKQKLFG